MKRIQIRKLKKDHRWRDRRDQVLPLDPRDPDILRARSVRDGASVRPEPPEEPILAVVGWELTWMGRLRPFR
jgi:hypothetical protein